MNPTNTPTIRDLRPTRKRLRLGRHFSAEQVAAFARNHAGGLLLWYMFWEDRGRHKTDVLNYHPISNTVEARARWHYRLPSMAPERPTIVTFAPKLAWIGDDYRMWIPPESRLSGAPELDEFFPLLAKHYAALADVCYTAHPKHVPLPGYITAHPQYLNAVEEVLRKLELARCWRAAWETGVSVANLSREAQALITRSREIDGA
jgi:hypothetical protein